MLFLIFLFLGEPLRRIIGRRFLFSMVGGLYGMNFYGEANGKEGNLWAVKAVWTVICMIKWWTVILKKQEIRKVMAFVKPCRVGIAHQPLALTEKNEFKNYQQPVPKPAPQLESIAEFPLAI